tara:strand:+ start:8110 stop:8358 length:249 start_codon:yes stop_codon:yes gene_type:complete
MKLLKISLVAAVLGILLNIVLSYSFYPFATKNEIKPPNGADKLSFKSQILHMLVHHKQVILTSSLIVGLLVGISTFLALKLM